MAFENNVGKAKMQFTNIASSIYNVSQPLKANCNLFLASSSLLYANAFNVDK